MLEIEIDVFSGMPNPTFQLSAREEQNSSTGYSPNRRRWRRWRIPRRRSASATAV